MTIAEAIEEGTQQLRVSGSPSARLDAELLLAHTLGLRRVDLYIQGERPLADGEEASYRVLLERRMRKEPVSYLLGRKEFFGLTLLVDRRVLVPRPETEVLVERALKWAQGKDILRVADIGTGSGAIAIALALRLPQAHVYAVDISAEALAVARKNVARHEAENRVELLLGDLCTPLPEPVDLLAANLPYTVWEELPMGITAYEPRLALDGGTEGLDVYRRLLPRLPECLRPGGAAFLEIGDGQQEGVLALVREHLEQAEVRVWPDYSGIPRVVQLALSTNNQGKR